MSVEDTIKKIDQACTDMKKVYTDLAKTAEPALNQLTTSIGTLTQWKYVTYSGSQEMVEYRDTQYNWFQKRLINIGVGAFTEEEVPHPRAPEARRRVEELLGKANANDKKFAIDISDVAETPTSIGKVLTTWLEIRDAFTQHVDLTIPSNPLYIPTMTEAGWDSPIAGDSYRAVVTSQNGAAGGARSVMTGLLDNCATFLASLEETLANYAKQTVELNEYYTGLISNTAGILTKPSFSSISGIIDTGFNAVNGLAKNELKVAEDFGRMLNGAIKQLLDIETLSGDIDVLGEGSGDQGWPSPIVIGSNPGSGHEDRADLVMDARYFTDHAKFWDGISGQLSPLAQKAGGVADIPVMFTRVPTFSADQSDALNKLSDRIAKDVLTKGRTATSDLADKLEAARRTYLVAEAANEAEVESIEKEVTDG